jgi:hypothetical protein
MADTVTVATTTNTVTVTAASGSTVTTSNPAAQTININSDSLAGFNSDALTEGTTNRYYTTARSRSSYPGHVLGTAAAGPTTYYIEPSSPVTRTIVAIYTSCDTGTGTAVFKNGANTIASIAVSAGDTTTSGGSLSNTSLSPDGVLSLALTSTSSGGHLVNFRFGVEYTQ